MAGARSHGRGIAVAAAIAVPVIVALAGSALLGREMFQAGQAQAQTMRMQEVRAQSRLLLDNVWNSLKTTKIRASSIFANPKLAFDSGIESVTPFKGTPSKALTQELRYEGIAVVPGKTLDLLFFANLSQAKPELLVARVNPARVFSGFSRWTTRREAGNLRGYLIGSDGRVLVHSESVYTGTDFSGTDVFKTALRSLFKGERTSGIATFTGADLRPSLTSYVAVGNLPLAVVVERVVHPLGAAVVRQNFLPISLLAGLLLVLCAFSFILIRGLEAPRVVDFPAVSDAIAQVALARDLKYNEARIAILNSRELLQSRNEFPNESDDSSHLPTDREPEETNVPQGSS